MSLLLLFCVTYPFVYCNLLCFLYYYPLLLNFYNMSTYQNMAIKKVLPSVPVDGGVVPRRVAAAGVARGGRGAARVGHAGGPRRRAAAPAARAAARPRRRLASAPRSLPAAG